MEIIECEEKTIKTHHKIINEYIKSFVLSVNRIKFNSVLNFVMNCHSIVSPIQFESTPKPLLVRKKTFVEREEYDIQYDYNNDFITVTKTEILVKKQDSSTESPKRSAVPHWDRVREVYFKEEEDPDIIEESTDEGVYEEVTHNSNGSIVKEKERNENKKSLRSLPSVDVSSVVSVISLTIIDYLSWTNFFKFLVILFCINGLVLQFILLTIQYFSYETAFDLQMISEEESDQNSVTLCLPFSYEEVLKSDIENNSFVGLKSFQLSDILPKIYCSLRISLSECQKPIKSISDSFVCFTYVFDSEIQLIVNMSQILDQNSYRVLIHSSKVVSINFEDDFQTLYFDTNYEIKFWTFRMNSKSLSYTHCKTYYKSWTRSQCLYKCLLNSMKTFCPNCVPKEVLILESDFNQSMKLCPNGKCKDLRSFLKNCQQNCPQDCNQEIYFSSVISSEESDSKVSLIISKSYRFSTNGEFEFRPKPLLTLELYFASLGGLSVIWTLVLFILFSIIYFVKQVIHIFED